MSSQENPTLDYLWRKLHIQQGRSGHASRLAENVWKRIDTKNFSDSEKAWSYGEYARIAVVTALSAAKKESDPATFEEYLQRSITTMYEAYPLAESSAEAKEVGNYWDPVHGTESAQLFCLRDALKLVKLLTALWPDKPLLTWQGGIYHLLFQLHKEQSSRAGLIFAIEHGTSSEVYEAYGEYLEQHGPNSEGFSPDQMITVSATLLGRSAEDLDLSGVARSARDMIRTTLGARQLGGFALREATKHLGRALVDDQLLSLRLEKFGPQLQQSELRDDAYRLAQTRYIGLGRNQVREIR